MTTVYECPEHRRVVLTASGERMPRSEAEALSYTIAPYADLVERSARVAVAHPEHADIVSLPPFGLTVASDTAKRMGFAVSQTAAKPRATSPGDVKSAWRSSIFALDEARERPAATAELLTTRSPATLTTDQARAFLRGMPTETEETDTAETMTTTNEDPRAERLAEIGVSMAAYNREMGRAPKTRATPTAAAKASTIEPTKLKRLAEIRLNALSMNGQEKTQEAKTLRLAIETHNRVGTPLAQAFAQLGFDTAKLLPSNA